MTKELNIIICDPFENCFKRIIEIVREEQLIKLCLKSKVSELIRNQTENGLELERLIFSGEKISINKSLELWRKTIIESELEKVYIQNFKIEQIKSLLAIFEENNYAMKNGWYLKKKSVNLSNKEEEKMKSIKKTDGNKGVKYVLEDKFNWMNRNQELYKSLIPFFNWTLIEID